MVQVKLPLYMSEVLSPDHDFSSTWRLRGGLTAHGDPIDRKNIMQNLARETRPIVQEALNQEAGVKNIQCVINAMNHLLKHYGNPEKKLSEVLGKPVKLSYSMVSGYSRGGGTYLVDELAKLDGVDIQKRHLCFCHDHYPTFNSHWAFPLAENNREELMQYFAALSVYSCLTGEGHYKRTVMGAKILPPALLSLYGNLESLSLNWVHTVRDFPSAYRSLKKMYSAHEKGIEYVQYENHTGQSGEGVNPIYLSLSVWFISNLYVLPVQEGLPFVSEPVSWSNGSVQETLNNIIGMVDRYLDQQMKVPKTPTINPIVLKYEDIPSFMNKLSSERGRQYSVNTFKIKPKAELDSEDAHTIYRTFCEQIKRVYDHYGFVFPDL